MQYPLSNTPLERHQKLLTPPNGQAPQGGRPDVYNSTVKALQILQHLQTTLDLEQMLQMFANAVSDTVAMDGIFYEFPELAISFPYGRQSRHSCSYRLSVEDQALGQLVFRRGRKFSEEEMGRLEELLCSLVYPLRNAVLYQRALRSAHGDPLTGLHNRAALDQSLEREIGLAQRHERPLSMLVIDIDKFKAVNDGHGHAAGDQLLAHVAAEIMANIRETDLAFRYGGEEFVVLLSNTPQAGAVLVAERIRQSIAASPCPLEDDTALAATVSIGAQELRADDTAATLFERTDQALYRAKHGGRNRVCAA